MKCSRFFKYSILLLLLFVSIQFLMADRQSDSVLDSYTENVEKLTKSFTEKKSKYKADTVKKLEALKKQRMQKGDLDSANDIQKRIKKLQGESIADELEDDMDFDFDATPPPPGTPAVTKKEIRKFKRTKTPEDLHKALKKLNPAYQENGRFEVEDGHIVEVNLEACYIVNIAPLAGLKYVSTIDLGGNPLWDLSPIKNLNLSGLSLYNTDVRNLDAIKKMKLHWLSISNTKIKDISVIKKMPLTHLSMKGCIFIDDLSPLAKCKNLKKLILPPQALDMDISFLKKLKNLKFIDIEHKDNRTPANQFWKEFRAR